MRVEKSARVWSRASRRLWGLLFFALPIGSCILNPQPEPPSSTNASAGRPGSGGSSGASAGSGGFGAVGDPGDSGVGTGGSGGSINADSGTGPRGPCVQARDCGADEICSADDGTCGRVPPGSCGPPAPENGSVFAGGACDAQRACAAGLTCVPYEQTLDSSGSYVRASAGTCQRSCDPCAPACEPAQSCFRRSAGGGFCAPALLAEGAPCDPSAAPTAGATVAPCAAGLTCSEVEAGSGKRCLRVCRPLPGPGGAVSSNAAHGASSSTDCRAGELCFETVSGSNSEFVCVPGTLAPSGGVCGGPQYCAPPERCSSGSCGP